MRAAIAASALGAPRRSAPGDLRAGQRKTRYRPRTLLTSLSTCEPEPAMALPAASCRRRRAANFVLITGSDQLSCHSGIGPRRARQVIFDHVRRRVAEADSATGAESHPPAAGEAARGVAETATVFARIAVRNAPSSSSASPICGRAISLCALSISLRACASIPNATAGFSASVLLLLAGFRRGAPPQRFWRKAST